MKLCFSIRICALISLSPSFSLSVSPSLWWENAKNAREWGNPLKITSKIKGTKNIITWTSKHICFILLWAVFLPSPIYIRRAHTENRAGEVRAPLRQCRRQILTRWEFAVMVENTSNRNYYKCEMSDDSNGSRHLVIVNYYYMPSYQQQQQEFIG